MRARGVRKAVVGGALGGACLLGASLAFAANTAAKVTLDETPSNVSVSIDPSCKGFVFDRQRLQADVLLELGEEPNAELSLEVRCSEDLHVHATERLDGALLEQTLDLSSLPTSSWHRALVLSFAEGTSALRARLPDTARSEAQAAPSEPSEPSEPKSKKTKPQPPPKKNIYGLTSPANELPTFGPEDVGRGGERDASALREVWMLAGGGARVMESGGLVGASLGFRYKPLFVGASFLASESSDATLTTGIIGWSIVNDPRASWSPLLAPRVSGGMLSRQGSLKGGASYFDAGVLLGGTLRFAPEWGLMAAFETGYGLPSTVSGSGGTASAGGIFAGALIMLGARP
jgi:hypothetical protein